MATFFDSHTIKTFVLKNVFIKQAIINLFYKKENIVFLSVL